MLQLATDRQKRFLLVVHAEADGDTEGLTRAARAEDVVKAVRVRTNKALDGLPAQLTEKFVILDKKQKS